MKDNSVLLGSVLEIDDLEFLFAQCVLPLAMYYQSKVTLLQRILI